MRNLMFTKIAFVFVSSLTAVQAKAQQPSSEVWYAHSFWDNIYVGAFGGWSGRAAFDESKTSGWKKQMSGRFGLYVGKWINPFVAVQAGYRYGRVPYHDWNYNMITADAVLDATAMAKGYNPERKIQILPFVGLGAVFSNLTRRQSFALTYGVQGRYNISELFAVSVGLRGDLFDNDAIEPGLAGASNIFAIEAGIVYNIGGHSFRKTETNSAALEKIGILTDEVNTLRKKVAELEREKKTAASVNAQHETVDNDSLKKVYYTEPNDNRLYIHIRFSEFSSYLSEKERKNIDNIAEWMKQQPDFQIKIAAFSDNLSDKNYDDELRQKRAEAIRQILVNSYKINPSRIVITTPENEGYVNKTDCSALIVFIPRRK